MKKIFVIFALSLLLISSVSAYYCIDTNDTSTTDMNYLKYKINKLFIEHDLNNGYTFDSIIIKNNLFGGCQ